jgi:hypothetical protein
VVLFHRDASGRISGAISRFVIAAGARDDRDLSFHATLQVD